MEDSFLEDVISVNKKDEDEILSLKDLIESEYEFFSPYIDRLYYIEANIIYMNYVCKVPQESIAQIFNIKQYGISKRLQSALKRLSIQLKAPDKDFSDTYDFLKKILPNSYAYILTVWYNMKTIALVSNMVRATSNTINKNINKSLEILEALYESKDINTFKKVLVKHKDLYEMDKDFLHSLDNNSSMLLVIRHKILNNIHYIEELKRYNSRGSHSFRKDWIADNE